ncbi:MAG: hypothetical protein ACR2IF_10710 [Terriglobales bacterium]
MTRIKSFGVLSVAKISGLCYAAMGLCFVPFFLLFFAIGSLAAKQQPNAQPFPVFFGVGFAIAAPFIYGLMGFVMGALGAFVYNLIAGWIGGIEMELQIVSPTTTPVASNNPA